MTADIERLASRRVVASVSGGKDSAAMCLHLRECGIDFDAVFLDTGWEHEATYEYLRGELEQAIGPITWLRGPRTFEELAIHKGMMPSRTVRFCTSLLKVLPMQKYMNALVDETGDDVVNAIGIRAAESRARSRLGAWEWSDGFDCEVWRPILRWSEQDVVDIHHRHGLRPNPLYLAGARRVGCWPCIFSSKAEIRHLAEIDPARVARIRDLEAQVVERARAAAERRGETLKRPPAFFQLRQAAKGGRNGFVPIDHVIEWSRTSRGGTQMAMWPAEPPDAGCMRWGLCETEGGE